MSNIKKDFKKTKLYNKHLQLGANMCVFAGFYMPLQYISSLKEHLFVRKNIGIFDVSHMGKLLIKGEKSRELIQFLTTNDINKIRIGQAQYTCLVNELGGIMDDLVIYKISDIEFLLIVNAINIEKNKNWINENKKKWKRIDLIDFSIEYALLSIQGPQSYFYIQKLTNILLHQIPFYHFSIGELSGVKNILISNTGYTGSQGLELYIPNKYVEKIWDDIFHIGNGKIHPCGIASRDSLRLEMGYRLYGKDISEFTTPIEAGLSWIVDFNKPFIAKNVLKKQIKEKKYKKFFPFSLQDKNSHCIPREGSFLLNQKHDKIGYVTSGNYSPILNQGIGLGYIYNDKINEIPFLKRKNKLFPVLKKQLPFIEISSFSKKI
ncbi:glycine cleavage system aminomethyltransferase GcvT [Blattabacterium cuenoti]|uniref:glycine cleavage system aminomethyltransferase GcvT n=1 Tax=Blattabacterium cuenoti TaxID=1653831 RepID=UPI00163CEFDE|nr:glycine cleavage system aminomethyltransferase GcvT [Blattabacterium cuenoti]